MRTRTHDSIGLRRTLARLIVAVALVAGTSIGFAGTASAWTKTGRLQQWATGRCLDSNAAGAVYTLPCQAGNGYQTWTAWGAYGYTSEGYAQVVIRNAATRRCLTLYRNPTNPSLSTEPCMGVENFTPQLLDARGPDWSNVQLRNSFFGEICVDANIAGTAYGLECNYDVFQTFRMLG